MSLNMHLQELRKKHDALSRKVEREARAPGVDSLALTALKKRKLAIKQEIERLSEQTVH